VPRKYVVLLTLALGVVVADQIVKFGMLEELTGAFDGKVTLGEKLKVFLGDAPEPGYDGLHYKHKKSVMVASGILKWNYAENRGAAFGLFQNVPDAYRGPLFHLVSIGAVVMIAWYFKKLTGARDEVWAFWGLPLVLGGAIGNYIDRIARGFVIDFIETLFIRWPSFNVADTAICIGVGLLVVDALVRKEKKEPTPAVAP
jgi:signal peptidase II